MPDVGLDIREERRRIGEGVLTRRWGLIRDEDGEVEVWLISEDYVLDY